MNEIEIDGRKEREDASVFSTREKRERRRRRRKDGRKRERTMVDSFVAGFGTCVEEDTDLGLSRTKKEKGEVGERERKREVRFLRWELTCSILPTALNNHR